MGDSKIEYWLSWFVVILCAAAFGVMVAIGAGCGTTAADVQKVAQSQSAVTALKIAACVQGALAEEQLEALRQRREQEAEAQIEAERLRSATKIDEQDPYRVPSRVGEEVEKMMRVRDAGVM